MNTQRKSGYHSKKEACKCNGLSQPPQITLCLHTSSTNPRDDVDFRNISTVRDYFLPIPHNPRQRFLRGRTKYFSMHIKILTREHTISHHKLYSEFVSVIRDEVFIRSVFYNFFCLHQKHQGPHLQVLIHPIRQSLQEW